MSTNYIEMYIYLRTLNDFPLDEYVDTVCILTMRKWCLPTFANLVQHGPT